MNTIWERTAKDEDVHHLDYPVSSGSAGTLTVGSYMVSILIMHCTLLALLSSSSCCDDQQLYFKRPLFFTASVVPVDLKHYFSHEHFLMPNAVRLCRFDPLFHFSIRRWPEDGLLILDLGSCSSFIPSWGVYSCPNYTMSTVNTRELNWFA